MRRNDLTPDEARIGRLIQSLGQGSPAPDTEFLKRLRETTTAAFLDAHRARTLQIAPALLAAQPELETGKPLVEISAAILHRSPPLAVTPALEASKVEAPQLELTPPGMSGIEATAVSSVSGRTAIPAQAVTVDTRRGRLPRLRIAMLIGTAALLLFGFLPDSLVPSRGVRLKVAFDNLARASSAEFEVHNGDSSSVMLVAQDNNKRYWNVLYPSGNAEVSDGVNAYFFNAKSNSLHFLANEESAEGARPDEKLLNLANVGDDSVRFPLEQQRPQAIVKDHGQSMLVYNYSQPSFNDHGTINVEARVDAKTNELVALNSVWYDDTGRVNFQAGVNVRSMNRVVTNEGFRLTPESINADVAMVEEVQGNPTVDPPLQLAASQNTFLGYTNALDFVELPVDFTAPNRKESVALNSSGMNNGNGGFGRGGGGFARQLNHGFGMTDPNLNSQLLQFGDQKLGSNEQELERFRDSSKHESKQANSLPADSLLAEKQANDQNLNAARLKSTAAGMVPALSADSAGTDSPGTDSPQASPSPTLAAAASPVNDLSADASPADAVASKPGMSQKMAKSSQLNLQLPESGEKMPVESKPQPGATNLDGVQLATKDGDSEAEAVGIRKGKRPASGQEKGQGLDDQKQDDAVGQKMSNSLALKGRAPRAAEAASDEFPVEAKKSEPSSKKQARFDKSAFDVSAGQAKGMPAKSFTKAQETKKPDQQGSEPVSPSAISSQKPPGSRAVAQSAALRGDSQSVPVPGPVDADSQDLDRNSKPQAKMSLGPLALGNQVGARKTVPGKQGSPDQTAGSETPTDGVVASDKMAKDRAGDASDKSTARLHAEAEAGNSKVKADEKADISMDEKETKARVLQSRAARKSAVANPLGEQIAVQNSIAQEASPASENMNSGARSGREKSGLERFNKPTLKTSAELGAQSQSSQSQVADAKSVPGQKSGMRSIVPGSNATTEDAPHLQPFSRMETNGKGALELQQTQSVDLSEQPDAATSGKYGENRSKNSTQLRGFSHLWYANPKSSKALPEQTQKLNESIAENPSLPRSADDHSRAARPIINETLNNRNYSTPNSTFLRGNNAGAMGGYGGIALDNNSGNPNRGNSDRLNSGLNGSNVISNGITGNGIISNGMNSAGAIRYLRRQAEPQTELLAGEVLSTLNDGRSLVRARLANNAELVLGPKSEVTLIKPTAVQLQVGELELNVPEGDQIELLGPANDVKGADSKSPEDAKSDVYYSRQNRSNSSRSSRARANTPPQIVTGRKMYRIENNQLRVVEQDPQWLADYHRERMNLQSKGALPAARMAPIEAAEPDAAQPTKGNAPQ
jgi:hypothetical protein